MKVIRLMNQLFYISVEIENKTQHNYEQRSIGNSDRKTKSKRIS